MITTSHNLSSEWLEPDGLGGFASGTTAGVRTRRYHALLLTATTPPTGRMALVNGFDAWVETRAGVQSLSSQCYAPGMTAGDGHERLEAFAHEPWPHWIYRLADGTRLEFELFVPKGRPMTCLSWRLLGPSREGRLFVRPFLSGRDYHSLHKANPAFRFEAAVEPDRILWQPYAGVPGVTALTNGVYTPDPHWYYNFHYENERARGLDADEDLGAPGVLSWSLGDGPAALVLTTTSHAAATLPARVRPPELLNELRDVEQRRRAAFPSRLHRAADAYLVKRGPAAHVEAPATASLAPSNLDIPAGGTTIIAGYPWFTDWGRDTFIALRGLCLATGQLDAAREILLAWAGTVSDGMLPNRFPDHGGEPEYNSVDASLWFIVAVHEYLQAVAGRVAGVRHVPDRAAAPANVAARLLTAVEAILDGYTRGTRFGIRADKDGLLACGVPGVQLTWMDAKVGDWVVTPRIGKPVEVQALWLNALWIAGQHNPRWHEPFERGRHSFESRFWNPDLRRLHDVVDVNHQPGTVDPSFRPNQILAVGGLPLRLITDNRAFLIVEAVKDRLWTPLGLRSLSPDEPGYTPRYEGGVRERDGAYHQGTAWPWLLGAFVDAWTWMHRRAPAALREARRAYLQPILDHLDEAGLGHVSEIADADSPYTPRGCPWQAWSVGEALWLDQVILAETAPARPAPRPAALPRTISARPRRRPLVSA